MDGHDNDGDNTNSTNNSSRQGIFSTPELTVDAEKIAQNNQATSEASRAKIASIFANTETGQQSQRLNEAMVANATPATEDIVINNGPKKRSKLPIILAVVVLLVVVVGGVAYFIVNNMPGRQEQAETPRAAFNNYLELLEKGPEQYRQEEQTSDEWFLFTVDSNPSLDGADRAEYLDALQQKYDVFLQSLPKNGSELDDIIMQYSEYLATVIRLLRVGITEGELLQIFSTDSAHAAYQFIERQTPGLDTDDYSLTSSSNGALNKYLTTQLNLLENYSGHGCMDGSYIDYTCTSELTEKNTELQELSEAQQSAYSLIEYNLPLLEDQIEADTETLKSKLGI